MVVTLEKALAPEAGKTGVLSPGLRGLTLGLVLQVAGGAFEALAVSTVLPAIVGELGGIELYGWSFAAYMLCNLLGLSLGGTLADRGRPSDPLLLGSICFATGL